MQSNDPCTDQEKAAGDRKDVSPRYPHQTRQRAPRQAQYKETVEKTPDLMALDQLLLTAAPWLAWTGLGLAGLTVVGFIARWGIRFRLVGVSSFTFLLAISSWAFGVSYTPPVVIEGAVRVPIVFDNGSDLVIAQIPIDIDPASITPTLEQIAGNLRGSGRGSRTVVVRLRGIESIGQGVGRPVILGETVRDFQAASGE